MAILRPMSDLHNEFRPFQIPVIEGEDQQILILAGDIHNKYGILKDDWLPPLLDRFKEVVFVPGNHDYWGSSFDLYPNSIKGKTVRVDNFHILDRNFLDIDDVRILGTTLWTDFHKNPLHLSDARYVMNDYRKIRDHAYNSKIRPETLLGSFYESLQFFRDNFSSEKHNVVVTHHAPCELSVPSWYKGHRHNCYYYSDLSEFIYETPPDLWIHGHIHSFSDYYLHGTRILCNPRGYDPEALVREFNPFLTVEIGGENNS